MMNNTNFLGSFITEADKIVAKLPLMQGFIFDWDGVFTNAQKNIHGETSYSEIDIFMINIVRLHYYIKSNKIMPFAIITGSQNPTAVHFAEKSHFNAIYYRCINKTPALEHFTKAQNLKAKELAFIFDDVVDLSISKLCGLRFTVNHPAKNFFLHYIRENRLTDYITKTYSGCSALREIFEMILQMSGTFEQTLKERIDFTHTYKGFISAYRKISTQIFTLDTTNEKIIPQ